MAVSAALLGLAPSASAADRAFELVSPFSKGGQDVLGELTPFPGPAAPRISEDGETVIYVSMNALPGGGPVSNGVANYYHSQRLTGDWVSTHMGPVMGPFAGGLHTTTYDLFTADLGKAVQIGPITPPATPDAADETLNAYLWNGFGPRSLITKGMQPAITGAQVFSAAGSADFGHVAFTVFGPQLNDEAPAGVTHVLYDWDAATGTPKIVGVLPNDQPSPDSVDIATAPGNLGAIAQNWNPVSADGSRIFFQTPGGPGVLGQLYIRIDGTETKHVSESKLAVPEPQQPAFFRIAAEDGSVAFFTSAEKLTANATTNGGEDLYRYDVDAGTLTDITVDTANPSPNPNGAQVQGVIGAADDGSRVYFVAKGVLDAGATVGQNNLYVWSGGQDGGPADDQITFIATGVEAGNWIPEFGVQFGHVAGRVTSDGEHALFASSAELTGQPTGAFEQAYLYDADSDELICASCPTDGAPASANALIFGTGDVSGFARTLTDDGQRVFFTTVGQLAGADTNGVDDVYEFDVAAGEINLISSGKGEKGSRFADASIDGRDVVFVTRQSLVGIDRDFNFDAYDARIGGGIASQNPPPPPPPCVGEGCRGPVVAVPPASAPGSATNNGPGNQKPKHKKPKKKGKKNKKKQGNGNGNRNGRR